MGPAGAGCLQASQTGWGGMRAGAGKCRPCSRGTCQRKWEEGRGKNGTARVKQASCLPAPTTVEPRRSDFCSKASTRRSLEFGVFGGSDLRASVKLHYGAAVRAVGAAVEARNGGFCVCAVGRGSWVVGRVCCTAPLGRRCCTAASHLLRTAPPRQARPSACFVTAS
jgi:hypothetical protein